MSIEFHPEALLEFRAAADYYETQQDGLGTRFINSVESALSRIAEAPLAWRIFDGDIRRYLTKVFPYALLYSIEQDYILIIAVMHCRREPGYWRTRR
jgi:toxin ParE1/3/4